MKDSSLYKLGGIASILVGISYVVVAYTIAQEYWGQGLAIKAARGILEYGFEKLKLSRMICLIDPENIGSQRVADKIGSMFEKKVGGIDGDSLPIPIYSIRY